MKSSRKSRAGSCPSLRRTGKSPNRRGYPKFHTVLPCISSEPKLICLVLCGFCLFFRGPGHSHPAKADCTATVAMFPVNRLLKAQTVQLPSAYTASRLGNIGTAAEKAEKFFADKIGYTLSQIVSSFNGTRFLK